jgi:CRP-like cAMP-binding protein
MSPFLSLRGVRHLAGDTTTPSELLTARQRRQLAAIASVVRLPARAMLFRESAPATAIFVCTEGVLKAFRELPSGKRRVAAFLFPGDLSGLAENGRYLNTTRTVTASVFHRIRIEDLTSVLKGDAELQFHVLCKVTHELRKAQRHAILLGRREASGRLAMFLLMIEERTQRGARTPFISLPMSRTDIADYLALSLEAVSRATADLARRGIVAFPDRHTAHVLDRDRLTRLARAL